VAARTSRVASVHATSWEGVIPRSARGPNGEAGAVWRGAALAGLNSCHCSPVRALKTPEF
jgi:hypothetical protein